MSHLSGPKSGNDELEGSTSGNVLVTTVGFDEESSEDDEVEVVLPLTQPAEENNTESDDEGKEGLTEQEDTRQTAEVEDNGKLTEPSDCTSDMEAKKAARSKGPEATVKNANLVSPTLDQRHRQSDGLHDGNGKRNTGDLSEKVENFARSSKKVLFQPEGVVGDRPGRVVLGRREMKHLKMEQIWGDIPDSDEEQGWLAESNDKGNRMLLLVECVVVLVSVVALTRAWCLFIQYAML